MPIDTPDAMRARVPPSTRASGCPIDARVEIPGRHLDGRLRHVVAANRAQRVEDLARMLERTAAARAAR